jgi:hypothetical protein
MSFGKTALISVGFASRATLVREELGVPEPESELPSPRDLLELVAVESPTDRDADWLEVLVTGVAGFVVGGVAR